MMQFTNRYGVRIAAGLVLLIGVFYAMSLWMPVLSERRAVREMTEAGGHVRLANYGPSWLQARFDMPWLRVCGVELSNRKPVDKQLLLLSRFRHLSMIDVGDATLSDKDWATIGRFPGIIRVDFHGNDITDADLERLKPLPSLVWVVLHDTSTTVKGRDELRKALPKCTIMPSP
ncbi:MAG TPA: hypothetical protein VGM98_09205 [Schlesneria sp.]|jgi:hypothetical protein